MADGLQIGTARRQHPVFKVTRDPEFVQLAAVHRDAPRFEVGRSAGLDVYAFGAAIARIQPYPGGNTSLRSYSYEWESAVSGTAIIETTDADEVTFGAHVYSGYYVWQEFFHFDTSLVPHGATIVSVGLRFYVHLTNATDPVVVNAYGIPSGYPVGEWYTPDELLDLPLVASSGIGPETADTFVGLGSYPSFADAIVPRGSTWILLNTAASTLGIPPEESQYVEVYTELWAEPALRPTLTVEFVT